MHKKHKTGVAQKNAVVKEKNDLNNFVKKKPGFVIGLAFFIVLILFVFVFNFLGTINPEMEGIYAKDLHENNLAIIEYQLSSINTQFSGQYTDPYEDDMIYSIKDDLEWLKQKENEIYTSKPSSDVLVKEFAFSYFLGDALVANQEFVYESYDLIDKEALITQAINLDFVSKEIVSEDVDALFEGEDQKRALFESTYNKLIMDYVKLKKVLLDSDSGMERKVVEAEKVIIITTNIPMANIPEEDFA